jgi:hypothetical protein
MLLPVGFLVVLMMSKLDCPNVNYHRLSHHLPYRYHSLAVATYRYYPNKIPPQPPEAAIFCGATTQKREDEGKGSDTKD